MTESHRREGDPAAQEHQPTPQQQPQDPYRTRYGQQEPRGEQWARGRHRSAQESGYPPPPAYPPAAPGWFEAHEGQPPVLRGETVPPAPPAPPAAGTAGAAAAAPAPRMKRPVALLTAVALAAAVVGGATAAGVQQFLGTEGSGSGSGFTGTNVSQSTAGTVRGVAEEVSPSVVRIDTRKGGGQSVGSGIVITADGEVVTNNHVVEGAGQVQVTLSDGKKYEAEIVGTDPSKDLALIKLKGAKGLTPAKLGDSDQVKVGDQVVAIGSPDSLTGTVTSGIVSALDREVTVPKSEGGAPRQQQGGGEEGWPFSFGGRQFNGDTGSDTTSYKAIQTDASLNPGNSGGALINMNGEIVGMPSAIYSPSTGGGSAGSVGLGFAIPVNTVKADLDHLRSGGDGGSGTDGSGSGSGSSQDGGGFDGFGTGY
jgi:putative serine protease PepD